MLIQLDITDLGQIIKGFRFNIFATAIAQYVLPEKINKFIFRD